MKFSSTHLLLQIFAKSLTPRPENFTLRPTITTNSRESFQVRFLFGAHALKPPATMFSSDTAMKITGAVEMAFTVGMVSRAFDCLSFVYLAV